MTDAFVWRWMAPAAAMGLGIAVLQMLIPAFSLQIFDRVPASGAMATLAALLIAASVAILGAAALEWMRARWIAEAAGGRAAALGEQALSLAAADLRQTADGLNRMEADAALLTGFFAGPTPARVIDGAFVFGPLLALAAMNPAAGAATAAACALSALLAWRAGARADTPAALALDAGYAIDRANGDAADALARRAAARGGETRRRRRESLAGEAAAALDRALRGGVQIGLIAFGAAMAAHGAMTGGEAIAMSILGLRALAAAGGAAGGWRGWRAARAAAERLAAIAPPAPAPVIAGGATAQRIEATGLRCVRAGRLVLHDLDLAVAAGETVAVTGDPGAGKSALLALLAALTPADGGLIRIDGRPLDAAIAAGWVGYVDQTAGGRGAGLVRDALAALPDDALRLAALDRFGISAPDLDAPIAALSAGERAALRLARVFAAPRRLILLDEPEIWLGGPQLDALDAARREGTELGAAILWATKRPATMAAADRGLVLAGGRLRPLGPAPTLVAAE